jgi:Xaa-Pro dipeptidase
MMKLQAVNFGVSIPFFFVTSGICTLADVFKDCHHFHREVGFPEEWRLHHQEGMTGYASPEIIATPKTHQEIKVGQAFARNPSIKGTKAEETFVLTESGLEVIMNVLEQAS